MSRTKKRTIAMISDADASKIKAGHAAGMSEYNMKMQGVIPTTATDQEVDDLLSGKPKAVAPKVKETPKTSLKDELTAKYTKMIEADKKKKAQYGEQ